MRRGVFLMALIAVAGAPALAQVKGTDAPITWEADTDSYDMNAKLVTASGNVIITQGDMRMRSDAVRIEGFDNGTANKVVGNGRVVVDAPAIGTVSGDAAEYDLGRKLITFTGKVVLTKDRDVIRGTVLTYNLVTNRAVFGKPGGRVQGLFSSPQSRRSP